MDFNFCIIDALDREHSGVVIFWQFGKVRVFSIYCIHIDTMAFLFKVFFFVHKYLVWML